MPAGIRPTPNIVRKALFDLLGQDLTGMTFLELFAGSGAVGFEAISRGAQSCIFVERDAKCVELIERNAKIFNINPVYPPQGILSYEIREEDAFPAIKKLAREGKIFDIIFLDPPYGVELAKKALKTLGAYGIVHPVSVIVVQHDKRERLPSESGKLKIVQERQYGGTMLSLYQ